MIKVFSFFCLLFSFVASGAMAMDSTSLVSATVMTTNVTLPHDGIPIGTVVAWPYEGLPKNGKWRECDGGAGGDEFYKATGSIFVPNYQGMFLRGHGSQQSKHYGVTWHSSGSLGDIQGDAVRAIDRKQSKVTLNTRHGGGVTIINSGGGQAWYDGNTYHSTPRSSWNWWWQDNVSINLAGAISQMPQANEIRPANVAVRYIIKVKG